MYFVVTDRFVNGDPSNDHRDQGGAHRTFDIPLPARDGEVDNIGYLGGDFKGVLDNADYIRDMGFTAVWITPIVDNPDEAFTGGTPSSCGSILTDRGKTGYHGYWGDNFYKLDEHLPSAGPGLRRAHRRRVHATGPEGGAGHRRQPRLAGAGRCRSRSRSSARSSTRTARWSPTTRTCRRNSSIRRTTRCTRSTTHGRSTARTARSSTATWPSCRFRRDNPAVLDYLVGAYEQWIDQGADAFRIDTIGWMPPSFWKAFAERIRAKHPGFFMFGEAFDYDATKIARAHPARQRRRQRARFPADAGNVRGIRQARQRASSAWHASLYLQRRSVRAIRTTW